MAFDGRVFRVLIASPSDVEEEREIAVRVIQEWNDLNAYSRQVVVLPLRWETHTAPEFGTRPQEVINRAIVDECDLLIGVFWTRIGTPTGIADSGTLEEIERVATAGKPVMLYFSRVGVDPDRLDLSQVARLKTFKDKTYPNALTENYKSLIEFRDKLARQIELKVRELHKDDSNGTPSVTLEFVDDATCLKGTEITRCIGVPSVSHINAEMEKLGKNESSEILGLIKSQIHKLSAVPVRLAINNSGSSGVRNLYVEVSLKLVSGNARFSDSIEDGFAKYYASLLASSFRRSSVPDVQLISNPIDKDANERHFSFEWGAIQPRRVKMIEPILTVRAEENSVIAITARLFADSFPQPIDLKATLNIEVTRKDLPLEVLLPQVERLLKAGLLAESADKFSAAVVDNLGTKAAANKKAVKQKR
jgi:hypothetical protein